MAIQEGTELFRRHQKSRAGKKTREGYAYLLRGAFMQCCPEKAEVPTLVNSMTLKRLG
jgi:hypothetical protein